MLRRCSAGAIAMVTLLALAAGSGNASPARRYLVVWAGDWSGADATSRDSAREPAPTTARQFGTSGRPDPDFLAIVDADPASRAYGSVVATVPVSPGNEPHHMQYHWRPGDRVFAGGLFSDRTFVFDVDRIPDVRLTGVVEPLDTPCGSVPDAYWVLEDGSALGTYMGGPNAPGDPRCNGGINNGMAGTPGTVVRVGPDARVLGEFPAAGDPAQPFPEDAGRPASCLSNPPLARASCANPHGIQVREDLGVMVTSDYAEPRNVPTDPIPPASPNLFRDTVRVWDVSRLDDIRVRSVSVLPVGSRQELPSPMVDPRGAMGIMEVSVTNLPQHKGAFASSMCGGQIYYTADVTAPDPHWIQVFDATAAAARVDPAAARAGGCVGAGWLQTSPDDTLLFQAVIGRNPGTLRPDDPGVPKMVYALDIRSLVGVDPGEWRPGNPALCKIDDLEDVFKGGDEPSCPRVAGALGLPDDSSGGPHWGAIDAFSLSGAPGRISSVTRIAVSNYFVARSGSDGNHRLCMVDVGADGSMSLDTGFRDEVTGAACLDFNRINWPHGYTGFAKPHSMLFVSKVDP